jgi:hypothetical protein
MRARCESCGTWVEESYTHTIDGRCLCVLCALQAQDPTLWRGEDPESDVSLHNADE